MKKRTLIIVAGFSGSGKSSLCDSLAKKFNCQVLHASKLMRELHHQDEKTKGWWEKDGLRFVHERLTHNKIDQELDEIILSTIKEGNWVVDSWTMPWLSTEGIKVWLKPHHEERVKRVAQRDKLSVPEATRRLLEKDEKTKIIYQKLYGIKYGEDFSPFHLVLDNSHLTEKQTLEIVHRTLKQLIAAEKR